MNAGIRPSVGFIGVGNIGGPMAKRLHQRGWPLRACDISTQALAELATQGIPGTTRAGDCADCDIVIIMVVSEGQVKAVLTGQDGLLANLRPDHSLTLVVMSSVSPGFVRDLAKDLAGANIAVVDAAVSGGARGADNGTLSIMAGGSGDALAYLKPLFDDLGNTFHCGDQGAGVAVKAINNLLGITNIYLMAEALELIRGLNLSPEAVTAVMEMSSGRNAGTKDLSGYRRAYSEFGKTSQTMDSALTTSSKDFSVSQAIADSLGVELPLLKVLRDGFKHLDPSAVQAIWSRASEE